MKHKIIGEDDVSYHVHDGKGHFLVAKKGISEALHAKIKGLPKYADGGEVEPKEEEEKSFLEKAGVLYGKAGSELFNASPIGASKNIYQGVQENVMPAVNTFVDSAMTGAFGEMPPPAAPAPAAPVVEPMVPEPIQPQVPQAPAQAAPKAPDFYGQFQGNQAAQARAINEEAKIKGDLATQQANLLEAKQDPELEKKMKSRMMELENERVEVKKELDSFRSAGMQDKIDPGRVWNNMSTGNKILATISLVLGGAGSGGNAANNAGLNVLNQAIDRDIRAQMSDKETKMNLYRLNLERYKDTLTAQEMTRMQLNSITQGKIAGLAARAGSEIAKNQAQQMIAQLNNQNLVVGQQLYERQAMRAASSVHPLATRIQSLPEDVRKEAWKELGEYENMKNNIGEVDRVIDDFGNISAVDRINPFTSDKVAQKKTALVGIAKSLLGEAMQEADVKRMVDPFVPGIVSNNKASRDAAKKELKKVIMGKISGKTPILTQFGLIPKQVTPAELGMKKRGQ